MIFVIWDYNPFPVSYYRLKQVDFDGSINYSKVICIRQNENSYNLRKGQEYIEITSNNSIATDYEIINTYRTKIKTGDFIKSFQIVKAEYSNGIYFIRLKSPYKTELLNGLITNLIFCSLQGCLFPNFVALILTIIQGKRYAFDI